MTSNRKRVTLYSMTDEGQFDSGRAGFVSCTHMESSEGLFLLFQDNVSGLFTVESKIQRDKYYERHQNILIQWSENKEIGNFSFSMAFNDKSDCDEIWQIIQRNIITQDPIDDWFPSDTSFSDDTFELPSGFHLPICGINQLHEIIKIFETCTFSVVKQNDLITAILKENYIQKLLNVFQIAENSGNFEALINLRSIIRYIFYLDNTSLYKIMFSDDNILEVIGCLEFDPSLPQPRKHREYLKNVAKFKQVAIPFSNPLLISKIHQTYRVEYIQDAILCTECGELIAFIRQSKREIATMIQEDSEFLIALFTHLKDLSLETERKLELILFLNEVCLFSKLLEFSTYKFYETLANLGIFQVFEIIFKIDNRMIKLVGIDILSFIISIHPNMVREFIIKQTDLLNNDQLLINIIIEQIIHDSDPELIVAERFLRILLVLITPQIICDLVPTFYNHSIDFLVEPLLFNTINGEISKDDYRTVQLEIMMLELVLFCVENHGSHIKYYIIGTDLLSRILVYMKSKSSILALYALRILRKVVALNDEYCNRHIIQGNLFLPVVDAFVKNNDRDNLLGSAIIELFDFIARKNIKLLGQYVVKKFYNVIYKVNYVQTFRTLIRMYAFRCRPELLIIKY